MDCVGTTCGILLFMPDFRCLLNWAFVAVWTELGDGDCLSGIDIEDKDMLEFVCFMPLELFVDDACRLLMLLDEKVFLWRLPLLLLFGTPLLKDALCFICWPDDDDDC